MVMSWTRSSRRGLVVLGLFLATIGVGALALPALGVMSEHGVDIICLELMRTTGKASEHDIRLGPVGRAAAHESLLLDYPFLVLYGLFLSASCAVVAARAAERGMVGLARVGRPLVWAGIAASACDAVENLALLRVVDGHLEQPWPGLAFAFASAKFLLIAVAILYAVVGLLLTFRSSPQVSILPSVEAAPDR